MNKPRTVSTAEALTIDEQFEHVGAAVVERLARNRRVRRNLPGNGRLRIDRQLPFLCVYRQPVERPDRGTRQLVTAKAAYLFVSGAREYHQGLTRLCSSIIQTMQEHFGVFLLLEIWTPESPQRVSLDGSQQRPSFKIVTPDAVALPTTIAAFTEALQSISLHGMRAQVRSECVPVVAPANLPPLGICTGESNNGCFTIGLEIDPVYRDPTTGLLYPMVLQQLREAVAVALRKAIFAFTGIGSAAPRLHFDSLGPTSLVKAVAEVDSQLCKVSEAFDFLRQVTPTNSEQAWEKFRVSQYAQVPDFEYRPLPFHHGLLKRALFDVEIERVEDATLSHLFYQKQDELDRQLTAIHDVGSDSFLFGSLQLYGKAEDVLVALAEEILKTACPEAEGPPGDNRYASVTDVVKLAQKEMDLYRTRLPTFDGRIEVCDDIASGIMVSQDCLFISETVKLPRERVLPLLHHEIGTHLLTYFNGKSQPIGLFHTGLAGYESLQEGLAVLAEYLAGGLTTTRLRALAGRVMAVKSLCDGATFVDTFRQLHSDYGFAPRAAFTTTLRVFRGGGLTKDAIYLRGLRDLLRYLGRGHEIEPLYAGKFALEQLPFVQELRRRDILHPPVLLPRFWDQDSELHRRLTNNSDLSVLTLLEKVP